MMDVEWDILDRQTPYRGKRMKTHYTHQQQHWDLKKTGKKSTTARMTGGWQLRLEIQCCGVFRQEPAYIRHPAGEPVNQY